MRLIYVIAFLASACSNSEPGTSNGLTMVVGDSISIAYQPFIPNSVHNPGNGETSQKTADNIELWLGNNFYERITFNNGLWDAGYPIETHAETYRANLRKIADTIKQHTNNPLYILTTAARLDAPYQNSHIPVLNQIALEVMLERNIPVLDLYSASLGMGSYRVDVVHFNDAGAEIFAKLISEAYR